MSFWSELKRRNVVKVGAAYVIVAWLIVQVANTFFPLLNFPKWAVPMVAVLVILGFPLALLFAWAFELTPDGLKKTEHVPLEESITHLTGQKLNYILIGVIVLGVAYLLFDNFYLDKLAIQNEVESRVAELAPSTIDEEEIQKSIAVLPFVNLSSDPEQEYFVDGLSEEILNYLAKIPDLTVTSRTSSFFFKDTKKKLQDIAVDLGVEYILEGSVRKAGNTLRITAQLIRAADDAHLWSEIYDRTLDDIFAVQENIATTVADELKITLGVGKSLKEDVSDNNAKLLKAAEDGNLTEVQNLLSQGASPNTIDRNGISVLMEASYKGHAEIVNLLVNKGADVNAKDYNGRTALMRASQAGYIDIVRLLLDKGADINAKNQNGFTALIYGSIRGHKDIVNLLFNKGADVNAKNDYGFTALMWASMEGHIDIVRLLLDKGADINARDKDYRNAFRYAFGTGNIEIAKLLLHKSANRKIFQAVLNGDLKNVKTLLSKEENPNTADEYGASILMYAVSSGQSDIVRLLLDKGAEVNAKDKEGVTALMLASSTDVAKLILDKGADVNARRNDSMTALMMASGAGHADVVKLLLDKGADVNAKTSDGMTAIKIAIASHRTDIITLLIKTGALSYDDLALSILRNAATAQEANWVDNETYADSIERLVEEFNLYIPEGVTLQIISAGEDHYKMVVFHEQGSKKYQLKGPGGWIEEYMK